MALLYKSTAAVCFKLVVFTTAIVVVKGCAVLYVDRKYHSIVRPLLVSWAHGYGFNSEFGWTGLSSIRTHQEGTIAIITA